MASSGAKCRQRERGRENEGGEEGRGGREEERTEKENFEGGMKQ